MVNWGECTSFRYLDGLYGILHHLDGSSMYCKFVLGQTDSKTPDQSLASYYETVNYKKL